MNIKWTHMKVVPPSVSLARIFTIKVLKSRVILKIKNLVVVSIKQPKLAHFHAAMFLSFDSIVYYSHSCGIVDVDVCGRLWMS